MVLLTACNSNSRSVVRGFFFGEQKLLIIRFRKTIDAFLAAEMYTLYFVCENVINAEQPTFLIVGKNATDMTRVCMPLCVGIEVCLIVKL